MSANRRARTAKISEVFEYFDTHSSMDMQSIATAYEIGEINERQLRTAYAESLGGKPSSKITQWLRRSTAADGQSSEVREAGRRSSADVKTPKNMVDNVKQTVSGNQNIVIIVTAAIIATVAFLSLG
ncbi:MAG: hypothetical protein AAF413_04290 [Patescibacteria group bacterium]